MNFLIVSKDMVHNIQQKNGVLEGIVRYAYAREFKAVVYDDFSGFPLMVTFLGDRWWVTTPGEKLQPLEEFFEGEDISFNFLCEAGGTVGALALAKMLGKAAEEPEQAVEVVLRQRIETLRRLGVTLDVKDEQLCLELKTFSNEGTYRPKGKYSMWCNATGNCLESIFDIDDFDSREEAEEWADRFFEFLGNVGIEFVVS